MNDLNDKPFLRESATGRGFALIEFTDFYDHVCSMQASSLATEAAIWLGINDAAPKLMAADAKRLGVTTDETTGWVPYPVPKEVSLNTRMHLTQDQVAALLPALQHFAATGEVCATPAPQAAPSGDALAKTYETAMEIAAQACDIKYRDRVASGHPREASTARALAEEIRSLAAAPTSLTPAPQGTASDVETMLRAAFDAGREYSYGCNVGTMDEAKKASQDFDDLLKRAASLTQAATSEPVAKVVTAGWQLVPTTPQQGMINAFIDEYERRGGSEAGCYLAFLKAAPAAPPAAQQAPSVKTWEARFDDGEQTSIIKAKDAEIADLRAALSAQQAGVQEAPRDERAAFEAWGQREDAPWFVNPNDSERHGETYVRSTDAAAWAAWQARAALSSQPVQEAAPLAQQSESVAPTKVDFEQKEITAAFDAHHQFYEFPSEALRGGALNQWTWGWWAGARAERAKSAGSAPASPVPEGWVDAVVQEIAEFDDRTSPDDQPEMMLVTAEELRDVIARHAPASPVQKGEPAAFEAWWQEQIERNGGANIGADFKHWANRGYIAGKLAAPASTGPTSDALSKAFETALEMAAKACDIKYKARVASGHPREASTARALAEEIRSLASTGPCSDDTAKDALHEILRVHANDTVRPKAYYIASNALSAAEHGGKA